MKKTLALAASLMIAAPAAAQVQWPELKFPLSMDPNAKFEFLVRDKGKNYYAESGHGMQGEVITFDILYSSGGYHYVKFYTADCDALRHQEIASSVGLNREDINANIVPSGGTWRPNGGADPAAIKAKMVCSDWVLLWK